MRVLQLERICKIVLPRYKEYKGSLILSPYTKIFFSPAERTALHCKWDCQAPIQENMACLLVEECLKIP